MSRVVTPLAFPRYRVLYTIRTASKWWIYPYYRHISRNFVKKVQHSSAKCCRSYDARHTQWRRRELLKEGWLICQPYCWLTLVVFLSLRPLERKHTVHFVLIRMHRSKFQKSAQIAFFPVLTERLPRLPYQTCIEMCGNFEFSRMMIFFEKWRKWFVLSYLLTSIMFLFLVTMTVYIVPIVHYPRTFFEISKFQRKFVSGGIEEPMMSRVLTTLGRMITTTIALFFFSSAISESLGGSLYPNNFKMNSRRPIFGVFRIFYFLVSLFQHFEKFWKILRDSRAYKTRFSVDFGTTYLKIPLRVQKHVV